MKDFKRYGVKNKNKNKGLHESFIIEIPFTSGRENKRQL